jgi:hypothetical protein
VNFDTRLLTPDEFDATLARAERPMRRIKVLRRRLEWLDQKLAAIGQDKALGKPLTPRGEEYVRMERGAIRWALSLLEPFVQEMARRAKAIREEREQGEEPIL